MIGAKSTEMEKFKYVSKTDEELKELVADTVNGKVFFSFQIKNEIDITLVFIPLALAGKGLFEELTRQNVGIFYEYISKANPAAVNSMPTFLTVQLLDDQDYKKFKEHLIKYRFCEHYIRKRVRELTGSVKDFSERKEDEREED